MSIITGATVRGHKCPDHAWCALCLVDIDRALDDYEDQGEAGLVCSSCREEAEAGPEHTRHDWEDIADPWADEPFGLEALNRDEDDREAAIEERHQADLLRERGRQP